MDWDVPVPAPSDQTPLPAIPSHGLFDGLPVELLSRAVCRANMPSGRAPSASERTRAKGRPSCDVQTNWTVGLAVVVPMLARLKALA
jgi:hypothetical protein